MRGGGQSPAAGLKFTLPHQREHRHVTTPPNDSAQEGIKEMELEKWGETGCSLLGVGGVSHGLLTEAFTILMWTPPRPLLNCAKLIWRSRHIFYANATVLSTQGASREAGGGLMGLDAQQGGGGWGCG